MAVILTFALISSTVGAVEYAVEVLPAGLPDLTATISVDPATVGEGEIVTIQAEVGNIGEILAEDIPYAIYLRYPSGYTRKVDIGMIDELNPGDAEFIEFEWVATYKPGEYTAILKVDRNNVIEELDETNNIDEAIFTVETKPYRIMMWSDPFVTKAGKTSTITAQLKDRRGRNIHEEGVLIEFDTTLGTLSSYTAYTDANGRATVKVKSGRPGVAIITGESEGLRMGYAFVIFTRGWWW